jgi:cytidyltransferase-like protein
MTQKRIMVDMSATIIHHGHIRLLKKASELGVVVVGLTTDDEIIKNKGYQPENEYIHRKEVLEAIRYVDEVVETPWLLDDFVLDKYRIDLLVHGDDNSNLVKKDRLQVFPRTKGVSSSEIRQNSLRLITQINNQKLMLTPGPAVILHENLQFLKPLFGSGDKEYQQMSEQVISWVKELSGQDQVVMAQGSSTFALELAAHTFLSGKILLISTGYYSDRLEKLLPEDCLVKKCKYEDLASIEGRYDWVISVYTESSIAFKVDLQRIRNKANDLEAKLYIDATDSIGLEENHYLADVMAFSSCKGLLGLAGACFIAYKNNLTERVTNSFYFNLETHRNKMVTGPYHAIASLYGVIDNHHLFKKRVKDSKQKVVEKWPHLVRNNNQPLLCTYLQGNINREDENIVLYTPHTKLTGSVICHFGEIYKDSINLIKRITVTPS